MNKFLPSLWIVLFCFFLVSPEFSQTPIGKQEAKLKTYQYLSQIASKSYQNIKLNKIKVKTFKSKSSFFKARFSFGRFLTFRKMKHLVFVNPKVFDLNAPEDAIKAILAHELAHVSYYVRKNRVQLLGLTRLASKGFTRKFERRADIETIAKGYGKGLILYRKWLYENIPSKKLKEKRRNYFSPEEINLMLKILREKPKIIEVWRKRVPKNLEDIRKSV